MALETLCSAATPLFATLEREETPLRQRRESRKRKDRTLDVCTRKQRGLWSDWRQGREAVPSKRNSARDVQPDIIA
eukprot:305542-Rhodomonas_salina.2